MPITKRTIILKAHPYQQEEEIVAAAAITPGHILERATATSTEGKGNVQVHSTADGCAAGFLVAKEDSLRGRGIDDDYAADDPVACWIPKKGDQGYCLLKDGEDIAIGDKLVSNGDGTLKEREGASDGEVPQSIIAIALETRDLSSSSGADSGYRCVVEFV